MARNLEAMEAALDSARRQGAELVVFPECATTGYYFESKAEALEVSEPIDGSTVSRLSSLCAEWQTYTVFGFLENQGGDVYNTAVLIGPSGRIGMHRKIHLPYSMVDRFVTPGDQGFTVHELPIGKLGLSVCYDLGFPEGCRVMALMGAELVILPTNWPAGAEPSADHLVHARAIENKVNYAAVNRCGTEAGFTFIGRSKVVDHLGNTLAEADDKECVIHAEVDLAGARAKQMVFIPGVQEFNRIEDRRPDLYGLVSESNNSVNVRVEGIDVER